MNVKKPPLVMKEKPTEGPANNGTTRPKNPPANLRPTEGYMCVAQGKLSMQASIRNRLITKPFDLFFEMQHAAFDIRHHRIIG